ncbi:PH domain-containing protein [Sinosporangium album]|uniref:PH domain-containing protein n=1 Tax=Sinosporangium album TaxID=504805 RepID=A0A1G8K8N0_9ACTN|nr:PH domain-containing protein [Sinosporangium album]
MRREVTAAKAAGAVVCLLLAIYFAVAKDWRGVVLAVPAALLLGALALRDVLAPVRLAADEAGLTMVAGFSGRRRVAWGEVTDMQVDVRRRLTSRTELLEIHTEDGLHVFSAFDLGVPCSQALTDLREARDQARRRGMC